MYHLSAFDILKDIKALEERAKTFGRENVEAARKAKRELVAKETEYRRLKALQSAGWKSDEHAFVYGRRLNDLENDAGLQLWLREAPTHRIERIDPEEGRTVETRVGSAGRKAAIDASRDRHRESRRESATAPIQVGGPGGFPSMGIAEQPSSPAAERAMRDALFDYASEMREQQKRMNSARLSALEDQKNASLVTMPPDVWSILKNIAMTPQEWDNKGSGEGSYVPGDSGKGEPQTEDPEAKRRQQEMDHAAESNNEAVQQHLETLKKPAVKFVNELISALMRPGISALSDGAKERQKKGHKALEAAMDLVAHATSHNSDTPGHGRGASGIPTMAPDVSQDEGNKADGFQSAWDKLQRPSAA